MPNFTMNAIKKDSADDRILECAMGGDAEWLCSTGHTSLPSRGVTLATIICSSDN